jgi:hypothetical protein
MLKTNNIAKTIRDNLSTNQIMFIAEVIGTFIVVVSSCEKLSEHGAPPNHGCTTSSAAGSPAYCACAAVVLAGACPAVILAASAVVVSTGDEPNVCTRATPGMSCAVARCCCSSKMLGQIANSNTAPILKIMPKEALDIISQYRECQLYK